MRNLGRRIRGAIGMGLLWAGAWFAAGILVARVPGLDSDLPFALLFAPFGFVTGIIFFGILVVIENRRSFDRMSRLRFAGWGAVSGLLLAVIVAALRGEILGAEVFAFGAVLALAGTACGAGSLTMARRSRAKNLV